MSQAYTTINEWKEFASALEKFADIVTSLRCPQSEQLDHAQIEQLLDVEGRELLRRLFQGHLDRRAATEVEWESLEGHDHMLRTHRRQGCQRHLDTLFGEVMVTRRGYGARGVESRLAQDVALMSFDEAIARLSATTGGHLPKRQSEEVVVKVAQDFEAFYETRQVDEPEASADLLVLTSDGKGMVMRPEDLREDTRKAAERAAPRLKARWSPGDKRQRKRMSTVASVYTVAPYARSPESLMNPEPNEVVSRPKVANKRVWASVERESQDVIDELFQEALRRDPTRQRQWVVLVDGAPHPVACIQLRSLRSSGDFEAYWQFHQQRELQRNHVSRYADCLFLDAA